MSELAWSRILALTLLPVSRARRKPSANCSNQPATGRQWWASGAILLFACTACFEFGIENCRVDTRHYRWTTRHLGTTPGFHPTYRGFDQYLGVPYSVDMGCSLTGGQDRGSSRRCSSGNLRPTAHQWQLALPLYHSEGVNCTSQSTGSCNGDIVEAPVNFTTLSDTYASFAEGFIRNSSQNAAPFFLYVPFSHVHTPQYVATRNAGRSGKSGSAGHFFDALLEMDDTVGHIMSALAADKALEANTLTFLSSL